MRRAVQATARGAFWFTCVSVALIICSLPSVVTGPF